MKSSDLLELSRELTGNANPCLDHRISVTSPSSSYVGAQAIVRSDGELSGWIGGGCVQSAARARLCARLLRRSHNDYASVTPKIRARPSMFDRWRAPATEKWSCLFNLPQCLLGCASMANTHCQNCCVACPRSGFRPADGRRSGRRRGVGQLYGIRDTASAFPAARSCTGARNVRLDRHARRRRRGCAGSRATLERTLRVGYRQSTQSRTTSHRHGLRGISKERIEAMHAPAALTSARSRRTRSRSQQLPV